MQCSRCGSTDWKPVTQQQQTQYKICGNCKFAPSLEQAEPVDAKTWVTEAFVEHEQLVQDAIEREQEFHDTPNPTTLQHGRLNKAKRLLAVSDTKILLAECLSEVVDHTASGQITVIIPEVGMYQFEWGDFSLFRAIGTVKP